MDGWGCNVVDRYDGLSCSSALLVPPPRSCAFALTSIPIHHTCCVYLQGELLERLRGYEVDRAAVEEGLQQVAQEKVRPCVRVSGMCVHAWMD